MLTNPLGFHTPVNPPEFWEDDDENSEEPDDGSDYKYDAWCEMHLFKD